VSVFLKYNYVQDAEFTFAADNLVDYPPLLEGFCGRKVAKSENVRDFFPSLDKSWDPTPLAPIKI